jgi:DNA repair protein RecO (recombination protein O)
MARTFTYSALVLRSRLSGESNREITFLTAEEGLIQATVFGGPKSKLRAHTSPYHRGKLWIYRDPVKGFMKVTDFDVQIWRPGVRELYERTMAASALAETVLTAHGGGGAWTEALSLMDDALDALDTADEAASRRILIHFLWNWAEILGQRPELACHICGAGALQAFEKRPQASQSGVSQMGAFQARGDGLLWYSQRDGTLICPSCAALPSDYSGTWSDETAGYLPVGPGARHWLTEAGTLAPERMVRVTLDRTAEREAKDLVTAVMAGALGKRLATWDSW